MKKKNIFLPMLIIFFVVGVPVFIVTFNAYDNIISAFGASAFSSMVIIYLLFKKHFSALENEVATKEAAILDAKLAKLPKIETPCMVSIHRPSKLWGAWTKVFVYLNDQKIGALKNGKTLNFSTPYVTNQMIITDGANGVIKESFTAEAGGSLQYKLHFLKGILEKE
jgi:hypothetical protein